MLGVVEVDCVTAGSLIHHRYQSLVPLDRERVKGFPLILLVTLATEHILNVLQN